VNDKQDRIYEAVREVGLDWHAGFTLEEEEENRYVQLWEKAVAYERARILAMFEDVKPYNGPKAPGFWAVYMQLTEDCIKEGP
jgi:hypothetical protein